MSVGRGSSARGISNLKRGQVSLPNLSVAGKREIKCEPVESRGSRRTGRRERRGCGGRGSRNRETRKPNLIEQQGIFSWGLNDDSRPKVVRSTINERCSTSAGIVKKKDLEVIREKDTRNVTCESEWLSDDEAEDEDLRKLLRYQFLADLKPGKVIPLVLPESEETQFQQQIPEEQESCSSELANLSNSPPVKKRKDIYLKSECEVVGVNKDVKPVQIPQNPTRTSSCRAAAIMRQIQRDRNGSLLILQLPSTLSVLKDSSQQDLSENPEFSENAKSITKHCLDGFTNGSKIGKLRIEEGCIELSLCGMPLDMTCGVATQYNESVLLIDSESQIGTSAVKKEYGTEQLSSRGYILGRIVDSFVCSHNLPEALDGNRQCNDDKPIKDIGIEKDDSQDMEMKDLLWELRSIERREESWSEWTSEYSDFWNYDS
ncbi:unnamed protein product [Thelazia callipaeda]|uniref:AT-hook motif nuclear-localized protein n=1 Tax=Thelazia callipaeda TaxID=103827 RepID=A0A158RBR6_THECL|nr:unnamed protein product [Thelazia callipaeda]